MTFPAMGFAKSPAIQFKSSAEQGNYFKYDHEETQKPGICSEIAGLFQQQFKIPVSGLDESKTIAKIIMDLRADRMDVFFCLIKDNVRVDSMDFIEPALFSERVILAQRFDDPLKVHSWEDIRKAQGNNTILVVTESTYKNLVATQPGLTMDEGGRDLTANLKKLIAKRGRFVIGSEPALLREIEKAGMQKQIRLQDWVIRTESQYLTVRKSLPPDMKVLLGKHVEEMRRNDDYKRILQKYHVNP